MKKTLHGKRHIRARRTVIIGRHNRQMKRMATTIRALKRTDWNELARNIQNALNDIVASIVSLANSIQNRQTNG